MVAMRVMRQKDPQWFIKSTKAKLLDKSQRGNELYLIKGMFEQFPKAYYLRYFDPSTGREYLKGIDPKIGKASEADLAQAWSFSLSKEEYKALKVEA